MLKKKIALIIILGGICLSLFFLAVMYQKVQAIRYISPTAPTVLADRLDPFLTPQKDSFSLHSASSASLPEEVTEPAYIAIDYTSGNILISKNASVELPIASLTKIMSAMVTLDLMSPQETIDVSENATAMPPTKISLSPHEVLSVDELLHAMLMTSANDAAQAVADGVNAKYTSNIFVWAMNRKAQLLGLTHTHFTNPQGFDSTGNYSTAEDLAILSHYAMTHYPEIAEIVREDYRKLPATRTHKQYDLYNWNGLLDVYPNISGIKIGNTRAASYTNIVVSERGGKKVLVVLLGASGVLQRDLDAASLLDTAFATYSLAPVAITSTMLQAKYSTWHYWN